MSVCLSAFLYSFLISRLSLCSLYFPSRLSLSFLVVLVGSIMNRLYAPLAASFGVLSIAMRMKNIGPYISGALVVGAFAGAFMIQEYHNQPGDLLSLSYPLFYIFSLTLSLSLPLTLSSIFSVSLTPRH